MLCFAYPNLYFDSVIAARRKFELFLKVAEQHLLPKFIPRTFVRRRTNSNVVLLVDWPFGCTNF